MRKILLAAVAALAIGCSSTQTTTQTSELDYSSDGKLFADYLVGSYANYLDDADARAKYYARAYAQAQNDVTLGRRAATSALTAGNLGLARTLSREIQEVDKSEPMSRAILGAKEFTAGRLQTANEYFERSTPDLTVQILMNLMKGWVAVDEGEPEKARGVFANIGGGGYFDALGKLQIANMEAALGNMDAAIENYDAVDEVGIAPIESALSRTRALSANGNIAGAKVFLDNFIAENGPFETGPIREYAKQLASGKPVAAKLTPQQEAARAMTESAFGFFLRNRAPDAAEVFLQMALTLDKDHDKARLWLGSILENNERYGEALEQFAMIKGDSPYIVSAKLSESNVYFAQEQDEKALEILEAANDEYQSFVTRESLGRARLIREKYEEALPIYFDLVESMTEEEIKANPEPLYFRGICYERTKQWAKAEADFKKVLAIEPDDADALNYLGYTWVDRNENLNEAFEMIRKAVKLEPRSGAIVDSLGWAHYKLGQYGEAKVHLERAVELSPSSATIIDHLGDVYWKLGRFREAGYQWERALEFDPTDDEKARIDAKLKGGLEAAKDLP